MNVTSSTVYTVTGMEIVHGTGNGSMFFEDSDGHSESEYIFESLYLRVSFLISYAIVFCVCIPGNVTAALVALSQGGARSVTMVCVGHLAFADLCVGLFCIFQNLSTFIAVNWIFGLWPCKMLYFTSTLSQTASVLFHTVIAMERYVFTFKPYGARGVFTIQRLKWTMNAVWLLSALIASPHLYYVTTFEAPLLSGDLEVICAPKGTLLDSQTTDMIYFIFLFLTPVISMAGLYARVGIVIWRTAETRQSIQQQSPQNCQLEQIPLKTFNISGSTPCFSHPLPHCYSSNVALDSSRKQSSRSTNPELKPSSSAAPSTSTQMLPNSVQIQVKKEIQDRLETVGRSHHWNQINPVDPPPTGYVNRPTRKYIFATSTRQRTVATPRVQLVDERRERIHKERKAVIKLFVALLTSFVVCHFPYHLRKICQNYYPNYNPYSSFHQIFTAITFLLMYANSAINPFMYAFLSKQFGVCLREVLRRKRKPPRTGRASARRLRRRLSFSTT